MGMATDCYHEKMDELREEISSLKKENKRLQEALDSALLRLPCAPSVN